MLGECGARFSGGARGTRLVALAEIARLLSFPHTFPRASVANGGRRFDRLEGWTRPRFLEVELAVARFHGRKGIQHDAGYWKGLGGEAVPADVEGAGRHCGGRSRKRAPAHGLCVGAASR